MKTPAKSADRLAGFKHGGLEGRASKAARRIRHRIFGRQVAQKCRQHWVFGVSNLRDMTPGVLMIRCTREIPCKTNDHWPCGALSLLIKSSEPKKTKPSNLKL
jgi:hypothetical protein